MEEILIIDRFEGNIAVCEREDGTMTHLARTLLPAGAREGSVLCGGAGQGYRLDPEREQERRRRIRALEDDLWED